MTNPRTLHEAFSAQTAAAPDRIALCCGARQVSYRELDRRASWLAVVLIARGLAPEARVGLCAERGIEMVTGALAILKAGGAYVPIDPAYPLDRIRFIVADSAVPLIVATAQSQASLDFGDVPVVNVTHSGDVAERSPDVPPLGSRRSLAYVIYTSGSTGRPKGVMIEHDAVLRLLARTRGTFDFDADDVWTLFHSMSFDFSVWELWGSLTSGGRLIVVPDAITRVPRLLSTEVDRHGVTVLNQTPTAFRRFSDAYLQQARTASPLRLVIFGGEALSNRLLEPWMSRHGDERPALINMYGITETTVHLTWRRVTRAQLREAHSFIGVPIDDMQIQLLDDRGRPVETGAVGRLYVSGPGLARGYLNRPALTAERFIAAADDGGTQGRLYDSGDLAARLPSGDLVYLGRADDQIKVRGFRIEPREIEVCLESHPGVGGAVVLAEDLGRDAEGLVAYVLPRERIKASEAGRRFAAALASKARQELPGHMCPADYRFVPFFPTTANGKIDRRALGALSASAAYDRDH